MQLDVAENILRCYSKHIFTLWTGKELFDTPFTLNFIQKKKNCFALHLVSQKWVKDNRKCCMQDKCIDCNINYSSLEDFVSRSDLYSISIWFFELRLICTMYCTRNQIMHLLFKIQCMQCRTLCWRWNFLSFKTSFEILKPIYLKIG